MGNIIHAIISNMAHDNPGFDVLLKDKIQEVKSIAATTKGVKQAVRRGARQIVNKTAEEFQSLEKEVVAVMPSGTGKTRIAEAKTALADYDDVAAKAATGLPGAGQLVKGLAPVGAVASTLEFRQDVKSGDLRSAVGSGTAAASGGLATASLAAPLFASGLPSLPPAAAALGSFSLGWTLGSGYFDYVAQPLIYPVVDPVINSVASQLHLWNYLP